MKAERVLVVEGDRLRRELVCGHLAAAGFGVVEARSGEEALSRLRMERARIDRLVIGHVPPALVCAALLADEFAAHAPRRRAIRAEGLSPADIAALLRHAPAARAA